MASAELLTVAAKLTEPHAELRFPYFTNVQVEPIIVQIDKLDMMLEENESAQMPSKIAKGSGYRFATSSSRAIDQPSLAHDTKEPSKLNTLISVVSAEMREGNAHHGNEILPKLKQHCASWLCKLCDYGIQKRRDYHAVERSSEHKSHRDKGKALSNSGESHGRKLQKDHHYDTHQDEKINLITEDMKSVHIPQMIKEIMGHIILIEPFRE
nr:E3 ubiquitin ligase paraquat tolerance 3-like isoform X1 [Tanacetum cinerariifolium]